MLDGRPEMYCLFFVCSAFSNWDGIRMREGGLRQGSQDLGDHFPLQGGLPKCHRRRCFEEVSGVKAKALQSSGCSETLPVSGSFAFCFKDAYSACSSNHRLVWQCHDAQTMLHSSPIVRLTTSWCPCGDGFPSWIQGTSPSSPVGIPRSVSPSALTV